MCHLLKGKAIGRAQICCLQTCDSVDARRDSEDHRSVCALVTSKQKQLHDVRLCVSTSDNWQSRYRVVGASACFFWIGARKYRKCRSL